MNSEKFSEAMNELDNKYVEEALNYKKAKPIGAKLGAIAACLAIVITIGIIRIPFHGGMTVSAYAHGTDEEITTAGVVISGGSISDTGEMKGHPVMFYLSGKDIATVRFSCKNQQINFMDWTEKRDEYGNAQNFTVAYGKDESEYYYLTIDWVPDTIIRELTDNEDSTIAALPEEMKNDIIVMEITFENGETTTKAITISLLDDGTFFASFGDYQISEEVTFVNRPDSEAIPRDLLYSQEDSPVNSSIADAAPMIYVNDTLYKQSTNQISFDELRDDFVYLGVIESDITNLQNNIGAGNTLDGVPKENFQANHPIVGSEVYQYGNDIVVRIEGKYWLYEAIGDSTLDKQSELSQEEKMQLDPSHEAGIDGNPDEHDPRPNSQTHDEAEAAARDYYENTVFQVVSLELKSQTENEIVFSACVSKGGVTQEPNRTITLQLNNGTWEVVNEGY
ncbi:hypothetical protein [Parabacteroides goldsteinii]|uniref:hypothetical protein n=1 Tax=Parabacteroides goldsteinii TaxID=328812 RepID=UPI00257093B4|nr:hypothetical protein [Parabacteroides goldsteinii]